MNHGLQGREITVNAAFHAQNLMDLVQSKLFCLSLQHLGVCCISKATFLALVFGPDLVCYDVIWCIADVQMVPAILTSASVSVTLVSRERLARLL